MSSSSRSRRTATAAAWVTAGALGATAVTGLAFASAPPTAPIGRQAALVPAADTSTRPAVVADRRKAGGLRGLLHGQFVIQGATGPQTVAVQRGSITAASATSITVASTDGFTATYQLGATTTIRRDRTVVGAPALKVGDTALVRATGPTATSVRVLSPEAAAKARARASQRAGSAGASGLPAAPAAEVAPAGLGA